jgi:hypothetical protein
MRSSREVLGPERAWGEVMHCSLHVDSLGQLALIVGWALLVCARESVLRPFVKRPTIDLSPATADPRVWN